MFIIWWIIVGLIAGFLTGKLMKGSGYGAIGDIVIGIIGAIVGGFIMQKLGYGPDKPLNIKVTTRDWFVYRDPAVLLIDQLKQHAGSHTTLPWREMDSNFRFRARRNQEISRAGRNSRRGWNRRGQHQSIY